MLNTIILVLAAVCVGIGVFYAYRVLRATRSPSSGGERSGRPRGLPSQCVSCGYGMQGTVTGICPECGASVHCTQCGYDLRTVFEQNGDTCSECGAFIEIRRPSAPPDTIMTEEDETPPKSAESMSEVLGRLARLKKGR